MSMGNISGIAALGWPISRGKPLGLRDTFEFCKDITHPCVLLVTDLADWDALMVKVMPPAEQSQNFAVPASALGSQARLLLVSTGPEEPLLTVSARHGFWKLGVSKLKLLAKRLGVEVELQTEYGYATALISHVLGDFDEDVLLQALLWRVDDPEAEAEFLGCEEAMDLLDRNDRKEAETIQKNLQKRRHP